MTLTATTTQCPGLQVPDGRPIPAGLVMAWGRHAPGSFPVAVKIRQNFPDGRAAAAIREAAAMFAVTRIHVALIPNWDAALGEPDWTWIRKTLRLLATIANERGKPMFVRLGNWGEKNDFGGNAVPFGAFVHLEAEFGQTVSLICAGQPVSWSVGDDRGILSARADWLLRKAAYGSRLPAMLEIQEYGERKGVMPEHAPLLVSGLRSAGYSGEIALVEFHRIFPPKGKPWSSVTRLAEQETGEYVRGIHSAFRDEGVDLMVFTGDAAFRGLVHEMGLNPAGVAMLDLPRSHAKPWRPSRFRAWRTTRGLTV